jgi:hypothetical protein
VKPLDQSAYPHVHGFVQESAEVKHMVEAYHS